MDKIAMYKEEIYKEADILLSGVKNKNLAPKKKLSKRSPFFEENFRKGSNVRSKLDISPYDEYRYSTSHHGAGRKNQTLISTKYYKDILKELSQKRGESESDYLARDKARIDKHKSGKKLVKALSLTAPLLGVGAGIALNKKKGLKFGDFDGATRPIFGGWAGIASGLIGNVLGNRALDKRYLKNLTDSEKDLLRDVLNRDADVISQDAKKGDHLLGINSYYY